MSRPSTDFLALANVLFDLGPEPREMALRPSTRRKTFQIGMVEMLRGALSNGFRAPSLHQRFFSAIATVFTTVSGNLEPRQQGTFHLLHLNPPRQARWQE